MNWTSILLATGSILLLLILFIFSWNVEKIKRVLAQRENEQRAYDTEQNKEANLSHQQDELARPTRVGNSVDPDDPWSGVRSTSKNPSSGIHSRAETTTPPKSA